MMKKILIIMLSAITLSACGSSAEEVVNQKENTDERFEGGAGLVHSRIFTDNETGCKYLFMKSSNAGGLSPLYNEKGEIDCDREENTEK